MMMIELRPVLDQKDSKIILYDIFIKDEWYGSRRTIEQCNCIIIQALRKIIPNDIAKEIINVQSMNIPPETFTDPLVNQMLSNFINRIRK